jgi:hypothetical protein
MESINLIWSSRYTFLRGHEALTGAPALAASENCQKLRTRVDRDRPCLLPAVDSGGPQRLSEQSDVYRCELFHAGMV